VEHPEKKRHWLGRSFDKTEGEDQYEQAELADQLFVLTKKSIVKAAKAPPNKTSSGMKCFRLSRAFIINPCL